MCVWVIRHVWLGYLSTKRDDLPLIELSDDVEDAITFLTQEEALACLHDNGIWELGPWKVESLPVLFPFES